MMPSLGGLNVDFCFAGAALVLLYQEQARILKRSIVIQPYQPVRSALEKSPRWMECRAVCRNRVAASEIAAATDLMSARLHGPPSHSEIKRTTCHA